MSDQNSTKKQAAVFAYSRRGIQTARKVSGILTSFSCSLYAPQRLTDREEEREMPFLPIGEPSEPFYQSVFSQADALVFVGAVGIAVRIIAPFIKSKTCDPAVLCIDELGRYVIPVLSGHIGGANQLASEVAEQLGAAAIITTATDINRRFSVDAWAAAKGFRIDNMKTAKDISAAILEQDVCFYSDFPILSSYPPGVQPAMIGEIGISVSYRKKMPFEKTLLLIPPVLHLGIGCRKGIEKERIQEAVDSVFQEHGLDKRAVRGIYSIDLKAGEPGLLAFCAEENLPFTVYTAQQLQEVAGEFSGSSFVKQITGVDNVCERAALKAGGRLIVPKTAVCGVTVAAAVEEIGISFEASGNA